MIQAKLTANQAGDQFEREADRVAEEVMRMPDAPTLGEAMGIEQTSESRVQRMCPTCEEELHRQPTEEKEEEEESTLQASEYSGRTTEVTPQLQAQITELQGSGHPLSESARAFFAPRLGNELRAVRLHTDGRAAEAAHAVHARAFALGRDIVFGAGEYAPDTRHGRRLLAHELVHTLQQTRGGVVIGERPQHLQRTIADGNDLTSPRFAGDPVLEACFDNERLIRAGDQGPSVKKLQQALVDAGFSLPTFGVDGQFGSETDQAVKGFQASFGLGVDGIVGAATMAQLDALFAVAPPTPATQGQFLAGPSEQSARIPVSVAILFPPEGPGPAVGEAFVSRTASGEKVSLSSPEKEAEAEVPYATGMSSGDLLGRLEGGQPLESDLRASLENRHGRTLSHVRIHADRKAASLSEHFGASAFTFGDHIAFGKDAYAPRTPAGEHLLRHEVAHVLHPWHGSIGIFRTPLCPGTCPPAGALPFAVVSDPSFNCYSYALNSPATGFLQPGQSAATAEFLDLTSPDPVKRTAATATYFTPAGMLRNMKADLGPPVSTNCSVCCSAPKRKIVAVTTDAMAAVGTAHWDFHWYRKDADGAWSHKPGSTDSRRDDASGAGPICNPCSSSRSFPGLDYRNVVGSWCV